MKCFIEHNSRFKILWEFKIACIFILSFWIIPINYATLMAYQNDFAQVDLYIDFIILFDIIINCVS